jgi:hypothetical protein
MAPHWANGQAQTPKPTLRGRVGRIIVKLLTFSYGLLILLGFIVRSRLMNSKFRVMDKNDKEKLAQGLLSI